MTHVFTSIPKRALLSPLLLTFLTIILLSTPATALTNQKKTYKLLHDYSAQDQSTFFKEWTFFDQPDPTDGAVSYQSLPGANAHQLIGAVDAVPSATASKNGSAIYLGVQSGVAANGGRASVRLTSNQVYTPGTLVVVDVAHIPVGCGTWPAFWMLADSTKYTWPDGGEVDIIEQVSSSDANSVTLHTGPGCKISTSPQIAAGSRVVSSDCNSKNGANNNQGCSISAGAQSASFGPAFNANGGGTYAMLWETSGISVWFLKIGSGAAENALGAAPAPEGFGVPMARFEGSGCDYGSAFREMQIVINTSLCGQWAGRPDAWASSGCLKSTGQATCEAFMNSQASVQQLREAYWLIRELKVYTSGS